MRIQFPCNTIAYLAAFPHVGEAVLADGAPAGVIRRAIAGTALFDALGPWPYSHLDGDKDVRAMAEAYRDFVTLTLITQPGFRPTVEGLDRVRLKTHFVYDPALPPPSLSVRARRRLRAGQRNLTVTMATAPDERMHLATCYAELSVRRGFAGGFFDFPNAHFQALACHDQAVFYRVGDPTGTIGMACGLRYRNSLHLLHIALTDEGLRQNAAYPLMQAIIDDCRTNDVLLFMGGTPRVDGAGIERFKRRWTNREEPVFLVRIVNDPERYASLCAGRPEGGFFPAYRRATEFR